MTTWLIFAAAGAALFHNGDFEKGSEGWKLPDSSWAVIDGAGLGGSKALVVEIAEGQRFGYVVSERFPVEEGTKYRFSVHMRNEGFKVGYGHLNVGFDCQDASGRKLQGFKGLEHPDNDVGRDGWVRLTVDTMPLPKSAATGRFFIWAPAVSCVGKLKFDGFSVVQTDSAPGVLAVHTSAYRDTAVSGTLRLAAEYFANSVRYPDSSLRGKFVFEGGGRRIDVPADRMADGSAESSVDLELLPFGEYNLKFGISTGRGVKLGEKSIPFRRVAALPKRKVSVDACHRTLVDGKLFFPLGMYWNGITERDLQTYTNGPFNCLMPYRSPTREQLDLAWKYGLRVIYASQGLYEAYSRRPEKEAKYREARMALKDHPAILAWYVCDELPVSLIPDLIERNRAFRRADPDHPTWQVLNYPDKSREFMDGADVLGCDPYPVCGREDGSSFPVSIASSFPEKGIAVSYGMRPMWAVPQMFNWGWYRRQHAGNPKVRMPTRKEMSNMAWQCVAAGANGLVFYSFFDVMTKEKDPVRREAIWQDMLSVVHEVKKREKTLLADPSDIRPEVVPADALTVRVWKCGKDHVALIVNRSPGDVKAEVKLPKAFSRAFTDGKGVTLSEGGRSLTVGFGYLDHAFVRLAGR